MDLGTVNILPVSEHPDGTIYCAVPLEWVQWVVTHINAFIDTQTPPPSAELQLMAMADHMRDTWREQRFADRLWDDLGTIRERDTGEEIVFTPYGYRTLSDIAKEL